MTEVSKGGVTITLCGYRWLSPDGGVESCRHAAACGICGQCSRLDGDHELGHCTGHLGLHYMIRVPGMEATRVREGLEKTQHQIKREQRARRERQHGRRKEWKR